MSERDSYRTILKSSSISGLASIANIATGLLKLKVVALVLGPAGIGLFGLYQNLMQAAATVATMGLDSVGTRHIAAASGLGELDAVAGLYRSLRLATAALAFTAAAAFAAFGLWQAEPLFGYPVQRSDVLWLAIGVGATVAAVAQIATLNGLRRIADLAKLQVATGTLSALIGIFSLLTWGHQGLIVTLLSIPLLTLVLGYLVIGRIPLGSGKTTADPMVSDNLRSLLPAGAMVMLASVITVAGPLAVRTLVQRDSGAEASGMFQAAWAIGTTYLGFVLGAMASDYYPRLTALVSDPADATCLINEQTEAALLLCAPVVLALLGSAHWVVAVLYAPGFEPAATILRWQLLGDVLKILSWPLGFLLLAAGANRAFLSAELVGIGVLVVGTALGLARFGVTATGMAFLAMYLLYLPLVWWQVRRRIGFSWSRYNLRLAMTFVAGALVIFAIACLSENLAAIIGTGIATIFAMHGLHRLRHKTGWLARTKGGV